MRNNRIYIISLFIFIGLILACGNSDKQNSTKNKVIEPQKTMYEKGMDELQKGNYTQSLELFDAIKKKDKDFNNAQSKINYIKGIQLFNLGKNQESVEYFEAVDKNDIYYSEAIKYLKKIDYELNKYDIAVGLLNNNDPESALQIFKSIPPSDDNYRFATSKINYLKGKYYLNRDVKDSAIMLLRLVDTLDLFYQESDSIVKAQIFQIEESNNRANVRNYIIASIVSFVFLLIILLYVRKVLITSKQNSFKDLLTKLLDSSDWNKLRYAEVLELANKCKLDSKNKIYLKEIEDAYKLHLIKCLSDVSLSDSFMNEMQMLEDILKVEYSVIVKAKNSVGANYYEKLLSNYLIDNILTDKENNELIKAKSFFNLTTFTTNAIFEEFTHNKYKKTVQEVLQDGNISEKERENLDYLKSCLSISDEFSNNILNEEGNQRLLSEVDKLVRSEHNITIENIKDIIAFAEKIGLKLLNTPELTQKILNEMIYQLFRDNIITNDKIEKVNSSAVLLGINKSNCDKIFNKFAVKQFEGIANDYIASQYSDLTEINKLTSFIEDFKLDTKNVESYLIIETFKKYVKLLIKDCIFDDNKKQKFESIRKTLKVNNDDANIIYKDTALFYINNYASILLADSSFISDDKLTTFNDMLGNLKISSEDLDERLLRKIEKSNYEYNINYGVIPVLDVNIPNFRLEHNESLFIAISAVYSEKKSGDPDFIAIGKGSCLLTDKRILMVAGESISFREIERWEAKGNVIIIVVRGARKSQTLRRFEFFDEMIEDHIKYMITIFNRIMNQGDN